MLGQKLGKTSTGFFKSRLLYQIIIVDRCDTAGCSWPNSVSYGCERHAKS